MEKIIETMDLTHYYGTKLIYENLNFSVEKGRIFGLLGKNGMGKTTTINILMGFLRPTSGRCIIFGEDSHKLAPRTRARIGLLHEGHIQYDFMTTTQIEKFYAPFFPNWKRDNYYDLVNRLGVPHNQTISSMSCGQRSQVALGLILAQDPELMILDDYSMGLDAGYRMLFLDFMIDYVHTYNKTVFMTSHIIQDMEKIIDDAIILGYQRLLLQMDLQEFKRGFHSYTLRLENPTSQPLQDERIKTMELIRDKLTIYTFMKQNEVGALFRDRGVGYLAIAENEMSLEEAFIGLTGKY